MRRLFALAVWLVCLCGAARAGITIAAPESADVGQTVAVTLEGLPAVQLDKPLGPQLAWADRCDLWLRAPDGQSQRLDWEMALYRSAGWLWRIRAEFTPAIDGTHWLVCDWNNDPAELPARAVFVGEGPTPPTPPRPPPPPPTPSDLAAAVRGWVGLVEGKTVEAEARALAADCRAIAKEARSATDPLSKSELLTADRVVAELASRWKATLAGRAVAWEAFCQALREHLEELDQGGKIKRTHLGMADVLGEISAGLEAAASAKSGHSDSRLIPSKNAPTGLDAAAPAKLVHPPPGARCTGDACSRSPGLFKRIFTRQ